MNLNFAGGWTPFAVNSAITQAQKQIQQEVAYRANPDAYQAEFVRMPDGSDNNVTQGKNFIIQPPQLRPAAYMDTFDAQGNKIAPTVMTAPAVQATPSHPMVLPILAAVAAVFILKG